MGKTLQGRLLALLLGGILILACGADSTNTHGEFDIYGRVTWRAPLSGLSQAEFYLFHNGDGIGDATILVKGDTVPEVSGSGHYSVPLILHIGDTLSYSISSTFGSADGTVIIPDTVQIIRPLDYDTLATSVNFGAIWHKGIAVSGYFAHLTNQDGFVAAVKETDIDTTAEIYGEYILNLGADTFWVETLHGIFYDAHAPNGMNLPKGVVGGAANYKVVYIAFAR